MRFDALLDAPLLLVTQHKRFMLRNLAPRSAPQRARTFGCDILARGSAKKEPP